MEATFSASRRLQFTESIVVVEWNRERDVLSADVAPVAMEIGGGARGVSSESALNCGDGVQDADIDALARLVSKIRLRGATHNEVIKKSRRWRSCGAMKFAACTLASRFPLFASQAEVLIRDERFLNSPLPYRRAMTATKLTHGIVPRRMEPASSGAANAQRFPGNVRR